MKVYVIIKEVWDNFCYEDQDLLTYVYGVFTNREKAIEAAKELNNRDGYREDGIGDHSCEASRGIEYYIASCETDVVGDITDNELITYEDM